MVTRLVLLLVTGLAAVPTNYLFVTSPQQGTLSVVKHAAGDPGGGTVTTLLEAPALEAPMGVAVDRQRMRLFVSDLTKKNIYMLPLSHTAGRVALADPSAKPRVAVEGVETRWLAVDLDGNLMYSEEVLNRIMFVPVTAFGTSGFLAGASVSGSMTTVLAEAPKEPGVSNPGDVAGDVRAVYWTNKLDGQTVGSVMRVENNTAPLAIARNADKVYGLAVTPTLAFFSDGNGDIFGSGKYGGSDAVLVTSAAASPRGLAYDGDGSIYVADKGGTVWSFPGGTRVARPWNNLTKVADVLDATGIAAMQMASAAWSAAVVPAFLIFCLSR
mmetsp:Transcript_17011/g.40994  ORF Transcript_17011/g.40994 Transcript_17011/m.40994 type:complete len:327 (-) Transcript_17011:25-1005(-)